MLETNYRRCWL